ncbi:site-specific DNA-methyltransferase [Rhizobium laguerreae]|uniref:site-specific DNA-methyltransferase n=1 Tax=Rhizobium laguerreae TaxID=1076926 RepID=UPI0031BA7943
MQREEPASQKTNHPCQFPEQLAERLVLDLSKPGQTVLDPFAGSGTVGAVCDRLERRSVLIERAPEYVDIIRNRLGGSKPQARTRVSETVALSPSIEDLFTAKPWLEGRPEDTAIPIQTVTP